MSSLDELSSQAQLIPLQFLASGSPEARVRYPSIPPGELAVVASSGEVWLGNHAWIVCLWALRDYRGWAMRFAAVSRNRAHISKLIGARTDEGIERELRTILVTGCEIKRE